MDQLLGMVIPVAFNYAPQGFAMCNGATLPITSNMALYALIGTQFGGNGTTNFNLPDLRGRFAIGQGVAPNLGTYTVGAHGGVEHVTLAVNQMPAHTHSVSIHAVSNDQGSSDPSTNTAFLGGGTSPTMYSSATANAQMASPGNTGPAGSGTALNTMHGYVVMNYVIATTGIYPTRS
jgi:microcystin-dependent protein